MEVVDEIVAQLEAVVEELGVVPRHVVDGPLRR
jgi:hypothetical protein